MNDPTVLRPGDLITLPEFLGGRQVVLIEEYSPLNWQVRLDGKEFLISEHVLRKPGDLLPIGRIHYRALAKAVNYGRENA